MTTECFTLRFMDEMDLGRNPNRFNRIKPTSLFPSEKASVISYRDA